MSILLKMDYSKLADSYEKAMYVMFAVAAVAFIIAIILFFRFNVVKLINDLSGRTAKKSLAKKRSENEKSGNKAYRPTAKAAERGKLTDKMHETAPQSNETTPIPTPPGLTVTEKTNLLGQQTAAMTADMPQSINETTEELATTEKLSEPTTALDNLYGARADATTPLSNETDVLVNATTVLTNDVPQHKEEQFESIKIIQSIVLIHTEETIDG